MAPLLRLTHKSAQSLILTLFLCVATSYESRSEQQQQKLRVFGFPASPPWCYGLVGADCDGLGGRWNEFGDDDDGFGVRADRGMKSPPSSVSKARADPPSMQRAANGSHEGALGSSILGALDPKLVDKAKSFGAPRQGTLIDGI